MLIIFTTIRVSGLENHGQVDPIWLTFWQLLSAGIGLILTAMTAFRTLCVARVKETIALA